MKRCNRTTLAIALMACYVGDGSAADAPGPAPAPMARVEINGQADPLAERREQTAAKVVVGREELVKFGDRSLVEALKRIPGLSAGGAPGRGADIRMRGLGNGYTQILINGEPPARGFPLDSIAPEMVDRVEIIPASTAEFSAQGIAGTINLVMKARRPPSQNEVKGGLAVERGRVQPTVSTQYSGAFKGGSYTLAAFLNRYDQQGESRATIDDSDPAGVLRQREQARTDSARTGTVAGLNPRISVALAGGDSLTILPFLFHRDGKEHLATASSYLVPGAGQVSAERIDSSSRVDSLRTTAIWGHRLADGGRLEARVGGNWNRSRTDATLRQQGADGALLLQRLDREDVDDDGVTAGLKWMMARRGAHTPSAGAELERSRRSQDSGFRYLAGVPAAFDRSADIDLTLDRSAVFVQDEWQVLPALAATAGLRWERVRIDSRLDGGAREGSTHDVFSPSLHLAWKLSPARKDQVRAAITRTYKSPQLGDLTPWAVPSARNAPTLPDRTGNPRLAPEVALGLDLAYERYVGKNSLLAASVFMRHIDDLIRREVVLQDGRWVSRPVNLDSARTSGAAIEAKLRADDLVPRWTGLELRASYSRYWSTVSHIPGPDNRLDEQPPYVANLGFDYTAPASAWSMGASANWQGAYVVRSALAEQLVYGTKRTVDLYAVWRSSPSTNVRFSLGNLTHADYSTGRVLDSVAGRERRSIDTRTALSAGVVVTVRY